MMESSSTFARHEGSSRSRHVTWTRKMESVQPCEKRSTGRTVHWLEYARPDVFPLRIRLVSANLRIPISRRIGEELTLPAEGADRFFMDFDAKAWPSRNRDVTLNHDVACVGYLFVPGWLRLVPFHGEEVLAGGYRVHAGCVDHRGSVAFDPHSHRKFGF